MSINEMIRAISEAVDKKKDEIISFGDYVYNNPETGFREFNTSKYVARIFDSIGIKYFDFGNIPGIKATIDTGKPGPQIALLGELDAIICPEHPDSDKKTGAVHACGHNAQIAAILGAALAINDPGIIEKLCGMIHFIAVPAEEGIEFDYRNSLREKGVIKYQDGKTELLHRGIFDDVDMCALVHASSREKTFGVSKSCNGSIIKKAIYFGKAAHAGGSPHTGINALYAANLGLSAINALRETFQEKDHIRVHPIITKGGDSVNVIPDNVHIESYIRGGTMDAIITTSKKIDDALLGGAVSMGSKIQIIDIPGYYPHKNNSELMDLCVEVISKFIDHDNIDRNEDHGAGSTDLGTLSALMPVVQPSLSSASGGGHSVDFKIVDQETAYILSSKLLGGIAAALLINDGQEAWKIKREYKPDFSSKEEFFKLYDGLYSKKMLSKINVIGGL